MAAIATPLLSSFQTYREHHGINSMPDQCVEVAWGLGPNSGQLEVVQGSDLRCGAEGGSTGSDLACI